jgi:uncharacterized protein YceK
MAHLQPRNHWGKGTSIIAAAFLMPFGSILIFSRRRAIKGNALQVLGVIVLLLASTGLVAGCSSSMNGATTPVTSNPGTPAGAQMVTITATSGALTQNTTIALTVQ